MAVATLVELLDAGVHFGHQTQKWNPKMKPYIFGAKNGIYILDLRKTSDKLDEAYEAVREMAARGRNILFVGTKKQAMDVIAQEATRAGAYYVNRRWLGGMMTNFETIRGRVNKLRELESFMESGHAQKLPKKEVAQLNRQLAKLSKNFQVLCITHLPQVASMADSYIYVTKNILNNSTQTSVEKLNGDRIIEQIAQLTGGAINTETSIAHARELKQNREEVKKKIS